MLDKPCPPDMKLSSGRMGSVIGILFILGSFIMFSIVLLGFTKIEWKDIALVIVGALLNQCSVIISKWYGASESSERKTEIMADTAKAAVTTTTEAAKVLAAEVSKEKEK
jgi:hypothetical protein